MGSYLVAPRQENTEAVQGSVSAFLRPSKFSCFIQLQLNHSTVGMSGLTRRSRRSSGPRCVKPPCPFACSRSAPARPPHLALFLPFPLLHHDDLFRPRMRSFSTLLSSCRRSGARSRPSSAALRLSVSSATKSSSMRPRPRRRKNSVSPDLVDPSLVPTPTMCASLGRERSTRTPRRSPRGQIQSTWTKTVSRGATATNFTS